MKKVKNIVTPLKNDWSGYDRTYNRAIDMVAQAAGWADNVSVRKVAAIKLRPSMFELFKKGVEVMAKARKVKFNPEDELTFHGYRIISGNRSQIDYVVFEYVENMLNNNVIGNGRN